VLPGKGDLRGGWGWGAGVGLTKKKRKPNQGAVLHPRRATRNLALTLKRRGPAYLSGRSPSPGKRFPQRDSVSRRGIAAYSVSPRTVRAVSKDRQLGGGRLSLNPDPSKLLTLTKPVAARYGKLLAVCCLLWVRGEISISPAKMGLVGGPYAQHRQARAGGDEYPTGTAETRKLMRMGGAVTARGP